MTEQLDAVVVGAGVVGLAGGRALAHAGKEIIILERHGAFGSETSALDICWRPQKTIDQMDAVGHVESGPG